MKLDLEAVGLAGQESFEVTDLVTKQTWDWGEENYIRLDPNFEVAHIVQLPVVPEEMRMATTFRQDEYDPAGKLERYD